MYADRSSKRLNPTALAMALAINGGIVALMATIGAATYTRIADGPLTAYPVPADPPPPPPDVPKPLDQAKPAPQSPPFAPKPRINNSKSPNTITTTDKISDQLPPLTLGDPMGSGTGVDPKPKPLPPPPVLTSVEFDQRYAGSFQPDYPSREQAQGNEGVVTLRVLVGIDGRVKDVEQVRATSPAFFEATKRQAIKAWRFKPATRDGVPYPEWKTVTARFVIN